MIESPGKPRSLIGQIREAYTDIISAQKHGFTLRQIAVELRSHGLVISSTYLAGALSRIRLEVEKENLRELEPPSVQEDPVKMIKKTEKVAGIAPAMKLLPEKKEILKPDKPAPTQSAGNPSVTTLRKMRESFSTDEFFDN